MKTSIMRKSIIFTILSFLALLFTISCSKDKCGDNKILVIEYDPMGYIGISDRFNIDIDKNGVNDIQGYYYNHSGAGEFYFKSFYPDVCKISIGEYRDNKYQKYLLENDSINHRLSWASETPFYNIMSDSLVGKRYLGVRILKEDSVNYGWVLILVGSAYENLKAGYHIQKTAFCTVPNQPILAGQECLFLEE